MRAPAPRQSLTTAASGVGLGGGGEVGVLVEGDVRLDDDDVSLGDELATPVAPHRLEGGLDHPEGLVLARLEFFLVRGEVVGSAGLERTTTTLGRLGGQGDRVVLEPDRGRRLDPLHAPAVADQKAGRHRAADHQAGPAHLGEELPARERLVGRVDAPEPLQVLDAAFWSVFRSSRDLGS